jgi:hypothetical protein
MQFSNQKKINAKDIGELCGGYKAKVILLIRFQKFQLYTTAKEFFFSIIFLESQ